MSGFAGRLAVDGGTPVRREPLPPGWPGGLLIGARECPRYAGKATLRKGQLPRSDEILKRAIHLDLHPLFPEGDVEDVVAAVHKVAGALL